MLQPLPPLLSPSNASVFSQDLAAPKEDGLPPILQDNAYRQVGVLPYANLKFLTVINHAFKSKRGYVTPADVAFAELCITTTLRGTNLKAMENVEEAYRAFLATGKANIGKHVSAGDIPAGKRAMTVFIGSGYVSILFPSVLSPASISFYHFTYIVSFLSFWLCLG